MNCNKFNKKLQIYILLLFTIIVNSKKIELFLNHYHNVKLVSKKMIFKCKITLFAQSKLKHL